MPVHELTPYRKLELYSPDDKQLIDVTQQLGSSTVTLTEETEGIDELTFTIRHGAIYWIDSIEEGFAVKLTAGYAVDLPLVTTKRVVFEGVVSHYAPYLPNSGKPELKVTCQNKLYELTKSTPGRVTYPGLDVPGHPPSHNRTFHYTGGKSLKISQIVKGILDEHNIPIKQILIESAHDYEFTLANTISQNEDENDFEFIQRLLAGKSKKTRHHVRKKSVNHLVNGRARLFMEVDPIEQRALARVAPESSLVADTGTGSRPSFVYQSPGFLSVDEAFYDPTSPSAELIITQVNLRHNAEDASGREVHHRQDVQKGAKGRRSVGKAVKSTDPANKGAQRKDLVSNNDGDDPPPDWQTNYVLNREAITRDRAAGTLTITNLAAGIRSGRVRWAQVKKYFKPRKVANVPSGRTISNAKPIPRQATTPTGFTGGIGSGSGGKGAKATQDSGQSIQQQRIKKYGQTLSFETHGNLFTLCRRSYNVQFPFGRYSGSWFAIKAEHSWGMTYKMKLEMGR